MAARFGGEWAAVQNPFIRYAEEAGWTYLTPEEVMGLRPVFVDRV